MFLNVFFLFILQISQGLTNKTHNLEGPAIYKISSPLEHGECPFWDDEKQLLYYVDIHQGKIFSYNYNTKETNYIKLNGQVAPVTPSKLNPDLLIVGLNKSILAIEWDGKSNKKSEKILANLQDKDECRLNDGKADKEGRIWYGTIGQNSKGNFIPNMGALHKITKTNLDKPDTVIAPVNISNGMAWNKANDKFYYIDSPSLEIVEYDYNSKEGKIANRRVVFDLKENNLNFEPDGMTIDKDDNLWIALYGGGSVIKVDPRTRKLLQRIAIPADCITSLVWGGPDLDILFVTTSQVSLKAEEKLRQPDAGAVFAITNLNASGFPMYKTDII